jgi:hypothetical protein
VIQSGAQGTELAAAHTNRGIAYVALFNYDRALQEFDRAIAADSKYTKAFANRGAVQGRKAVVRGGDCRLHPGDRTRSAIGNGVRRSSEHVSTERQLDEAIRDYGEAIARDAKFAEALLNRAITLAGTSRCAEAIADFTRAIEINPREPIAFVDRGVCYESQAGPIWPCRTTRRIFVWMRGRLTASNGARRCTSRRATSLPPSPIFRRRLSSTPVPRRRSTAAASSSARAVTLPGGDADIATAIAMRPGVVETMAARGVKP